MAESKACSGWVSDGTFRGHSCGKPGKVQVGGEWYCGVHDPERLAKVRQANTDKHTAERMRKFRQEEARKRLMNQVQAKADCFDDLVKALRDALDYVVSPKAREFAEATLKKAEDIA